jgi:hypothetical protein
VNSKRKGKAGELDAARAVLQHLGLELRRTAQVDGKLSADLIGWEGVHVECKRRASIAALNHLRQAESDAKGEVPIVLMREDGDTEWVVMLRLSDLPELARRVP